LILPTVVLCRFGLVDPVFTSFSTEGALDLEPVQAYANWTHTGGTDTIILGGSTGEWPSLSTDERLTVLKAWREALDALPTREAPLRPRPRLMFHAGDINIPRAQVLAREARSAGADALLIVAPCIMRPATVQMLAEVIGMVANESTLPSFYYHYPALYGVDFPMSEFLQEVMSSGTVPTLAGVKFIDDPIKGGLANITHLADGRFEILAALTGNLSHAVDIGLGGLISYTPLASLVNAFYNAYQAGDTAAAQAAQTRVNLLMSSLKAAGDSKMGARYSSRLLRELDLGPPRVPLQGLSSEQVKAVDEALVRNGFAGEA